MTPATVDAVIDKLSGFKDQICACPDTDCMEKVNDQMTAWGKQQAKGLKDAQLTDDQTKRLGAVMQEMQKCAKRTANMGG